MNRAGHVCFPACAERMDAARHGCFLWDADREAYVMPDLPPRRVAGDVRVAWSLKHLETRHGEPYTWPPGSACPWCGGDLPSATPDPSEPWR